MLYTFFRNWVRISLLFFYRKRVVNEVRHLRSKGPLILACNHPDSFLDALFFGAFMQQPVYSITRGDVFKKPAIIRLLRSFKMIPIFRIRDGKDKLKENEQTFDEMQQVLSKGGIILIFVEGICEYQTELIRPLKKGAPRTIIDSWNKGIDVRVLPVWLRYDSFFDFGKIIDVNFGSAFGQEVIDTADNDAARIMKVNRETERQLLQLSALPSAYRSAPRWLRTLLWPFAKIAWLLHAPYYLPIRSFVKRKTADNRHYDSVLMAILTFTYPLYVLLISLLLLAFTGHVASWSAFIIMPLLAKVYLTWKK